MPSPEEQPVGPGMNKASGRNPKNRFCQLLGIFPQPLRSLPGQKSQCVILVLLMHLFTFDFLALSLVWILKHLSNSTFSFNKL